MADAPATARRPLQWGILGPGRIAPRIVRALDGNPRGELRAVAGRDEGRARAFAARYGAPVTHPTFDALLDDPLVDAVYIALPNGLHAEWTIRALDAGKHVLCEKPLALSVAEVDGIVAAAARNGRIAAEAFMYLHHPQILRALELIRSGALGTVQLISGAFSFLLDYANDPRIDPDQGGGSLWDVGCYPVSVSRRIAGEEPDGVAGFARFDERGVDRTFVGLLHFPSGLVAHFEESRKSKGIQRGRTGVPPDSRRYPRRHRTARGHFTRRPSKRPITLRNTAERANLHVKPIRGRRHPTGAASRHIAWAGRLLVGQVAA